jgi:DNA polymerase kappa
MASYNKDASGKLDSTVSYATDIGLFKAGMDTIDQEEVKKVIADSSGNSEYFKTQECKLRAVEQKVRRYLWKLKNFKANKDLWTKTKEIVKESVDGYMSKREIRRTWMHVDLDMFYAACEIRDRPELKKKPVAVGDNTMI